MRKSKKVEESEASLKRKYGVPETSRLRWSGLKGVYWYFFSRFVRMRDFILYQSCISCGKKVENWMNADAGHYVAVSHCGFGLLFHEQAVALQHKACNNPTWTPDAGAGFSHGIDERYGKGTSKKLWDMRTKETKAWSEREFIRHIHDMQDRVLELETQL